MNAPDPFRIDSPTCISFSGGRTSKVRPVVVTPALVSAFWSRVELGLPTACWEWQGHVERSGYGTLSAKFKQGPLKAHRISYAIHNGSVPDGMLVLHHCDNRRCVNPQHLYAGNDADNMRDAKERNRVRGGAIRVRFGSETNCAKLTEVDVMQIIGALANKTNTEIGAIYGVARRTVADIRMRRTWPKVWEAMP